MTEHAEAIRYALEHAIATCDVAEGEDENYDEIVSESRAALAALDALLAERDSYREALVAAHRLIAEHHVVGLFDNALVGDTCHVCGGLFAAGGEAT